MKRLFYLFAILLLVSGCSTQSKTDLALEDTAANDDISTLPELGAATNTDALLGVNAGNAAGSRGSRVLFSGDDKVLNGTGAWRDLTAELAGKVGNTGNETIAGVKTFSSSPILPTPTTDMQGATKKYVDDNVGGTFTGDAGDVPIVDTGTYFTTDNVNAALQQIGAELDAAVDITAGTGITISSGEISVTASTYQAYSANLGTYAGIAPSANAQTILGHTFSQMRADLDLEAGTDFAAYGKTPAVTNSKATTYTIGTDNANEAFGGTIYVTSATTITAPAIAVEQNFCVVTIGDIAVSLDVNASDKMILDGVTLADGDKATNTSKAGDTICCQYYSADGQYCWSGTVLGGHWTDGN